MVVLGRVPLERNGECRVGAAVADPLAADHSFGPGVARGRRRTAQTSRRGPEPATIDCAVMPAEDHRLEASGTGRI